MTNPMRPLFTKASLEQLGMIIPDIKFRRKIEEFIQEDAENPPPPGGPLFVGDSDIGYWNFEGVFADGFADLQAINRGFGGARTWEVLLFFHEVVLPYCPKTIVYNCGDNDIAALNKIGAKAAVTGVRLFFETVAQHLPETQHILYLAIHPAPSNRPLWRYQEEANEEIRTLCAERANVEFIDYLHLIHDKDGTLRQDIFLADRLHYAPCFYRELNEFVRPRLIEV